MPNEEEMERIFYEWFPMPTEINPFHFKNDGVSPIPLDAEEARRELFNAWDEWMDKLPVENITEDDVKRWEAVYKKFYRIIDQGVKPEFKKVYL